MKVEKINTFEREYKYELPLVYKEFCVNMMDLV
mgnify:FL=1